LNKSGRVGGVARSLPLAVCALAFLILAVPAEPAGPGRRLSLRKPAERAGAGVAPSSAPAPRRDFPHLLTAYGPRSQPSFTPVPLSDWPAGARRSLAVTRGAADRPGNARFDPHLNLPPSVLPGSRLERASALLKAGGGEEFRRLYHRARAEAEPVTVRILALRVDFLDDTPGRKTTGDGRFDLRRDDEARAEPIDPPPHDRRYFEAHLEALARYYDVMSAGTVRLEWDVFPAENDSAYHLPDTRKYGPWIFSNSNPDVLVHAIDLVGDALATADSVDASIDFSRYHSFILFHAGADFQGDLNGDSPWDIPSFNLYVAEPFVVQDSTVSVNLVQVVPESSAQDGFYAALNGVLTHEFGHQLGFTDLYDVKNGLPIVGQFSLMDSGDNLYGLIPDPDDSTQALPVRGTLPASLDPWHKTLFFPDGVDLVFAPDSLAGDDSALVTTLPSSQLGNRILQVPLSLTEYLLVENRVWELNGDVHPDTLHPFLKQDDSTGVILGPVPGDSLAPADDVGHREYDYLLEAQGIVQWHVDWAAILTGLNTPYGGVNIFYSRPGVGVLEADGIRDIGTASSEYLGGPFDAWFQGGYTCLTPESTPSSDTNDGTPTGLTVCALDSVQVEARVSVTARSFPSGWPNYVLGSPEEEQLLVLDLDGDGGSELLAASRDSVGSIFAWRPDGGGFGPGGDSLLAAFPRPIDGGLAGRERFRYGTGPGGDVGPLVAAVAGGALHFLDGRGNALPPWPPALPGVRDSLVTCTPVVLDSLVFVGCADGWIRALAPGLVSTVRARFRAGDEAVRSLGAGMLHAEGHETDLTLFWILDDGACGALRWSGRAGDAAEPLFQAASASPDGGPASTEAWVLAAPSGPGGEERFLFAQGNGALEWRRTDGGLLPGWPARLPVGLAGGPILCDADADGALETVALDRGGRLHVLGEDGVPEFRWPKLLWSEDYVDPPEQECGPRALDVTGDGVPEILVNRADGFLLALDGRGEDVPGWPLSLGMPGRAGPEYLPGGGGFAPRLALANTYWQDLQGQDQTAFSVVRTLARGDSTGSFAVAGVDAGRSRVYPKVRLPGPAPAPAEGARESFRLYPNPVRGDAVTVRVVLDRPARLFLQAFDLAGHEAARFEADGQPGAGGNHLLWDLSALAPGLYQVRARLRGAGLEEEVFQKLAIVR